MVWGTLTLLKSTNGKFPISTGHGAEDSYYSEPHSTHRHDKAEADDEATKADG